MENLQDDTPQHEILVETLVMKVGQQVRGSISIVDLLS